MSQVKIIECPRDAMQGIHEFIPTKTKISYINDLIKCGFDTIDFGSFVSPKSIPQLRDTADVLNNLDFANSTKLLAIIANKRGAIDACNFDEIDYLGFPFSVSETFQKRNTNSSIEESLKVVDEIQQLALLHKKKLVVYLSMGFGNPYGDEWNTDIVIKWAEILYSKLDVKIQALSDTIGVASTESINNLFTTLLPNLPNVEFGAHLHVKPTDAKMMIESAYNAGCRRFDGAIKGFGGCPMATDKMTGNMPTETMLEWFNSNNISNGININLFEKAINHSTSVFP